MTDGLNAIKQWYSRNPVGEFLIMSLVAVLLFGGFSTVHVMIGWILLFVFLIDRGARFYEYFKKSRTDASQVAKKEFHGDPLEELRHRYATGELTDSEFERKLERLLETEGIEVSNPAADSNEMTETA
ncbi:SHOCT domain-containing protein [Halocatena halophila]|uniref:SHOCT domain-containing protein n=1 Tax=Halocatena halophila TaxID=2814576 RepID=UPI002ED1AAF9